MSLLPDQVRRYTRHLFLDGVGAAGQLKLLAGSARIERVSGAGAIALEYLAAAGVGTLVVADPDPARFVAAQARVAELNPDVRVVSPTDASVLGSRLAPTRAGTETSTDSIDALEQGAAVAGRIVKEILAS